MYPEQGKYNSSRRVATNPEVEVALDRHILLLAEEPYSGGTNAEDATWNLVFLALQHARTPEAFFHQLPQARLATDLLAKAGITDPLFAGRDACFEALAPYITAAIGRLWYRGQLTTAVYLVPNWHGPESNEANEAD
jgi:hypothetical protein